MTVCFGQCLSCGHTVSALTSLGVWQGIIAHVQYAHPAPSPTDSAPGRAVTESGSPDHDPTGAPTTGDS